VFFVLLSVGVAIDFDAVPENAADIGTSLRFLLSNKASSLRNLLREEAVTVADILFRQGLSNLPYNM
jgi:hypothetical protein